MRNENECLTNPAGTISLNLKKYDIYIFNLVFIIFFLVSEPSFSYHHGSSSDTNEHLPPTDHSEPHQIFDTYSLLYYDSRPTLSAI